MPTQLHPASSAFVSGPFAPVLRHVWRAAAHSGISRLAWSIYACCLAVIWITLASTLYMSWKGERDLRESRAHLNAKGFAEYVGLNVFVVDRLLADIATDYQAGRGLPRQGDIDRQLGSLGLALLQVAVSDAQGNITASSLEMKGGVSIADRKHFKDVRDNPVDRLYISQPVIGRVSKRMSLQLVRPLKDEAGRFQGVIVGSIDPTLLQTYFRNYDGLADGGAVSVVGLDGVMRLRMQGENITWGQDVSGLPTWPLVTGRQRGGYSAISSVDGMSRDYAFMRVGDYPLSVVVGYRKPPVIDLTDPTTVLSIALATAFSLVLAAMAFLLAQLGQGQIELIHRLRESRAKALEANQMKSNFLASVSHELRTPLNAILGFSELIREMAVDPMVRKYGDLVHRSGKHLHALVGTVLDLAKIEAGRMEVVMDKVDLRELLTAIVEVHQVSADKKGLTLAVNLPADGELNLTTDRTKVVQVLNNVLHNAIKFTSQGGIFVSGEWVPDGFVVSVLDTGCGIPDDMQARVFDRFNTVGATAGAANTQQLDHGTGLGLALSRELIELVGGKIELTSEVNVGTRVRFTLPIQSKE